MKRLIVFFFALAIFLFSPKDALAQNLLQNSGFEEVDSSWLTTHSRIWFTYSSDFYLNGSKAARVTNTSSSSYGIEQVISTIESGEEYSFFGYAHSNDTNTSSVRLRLAWYESTDGSGLQISPVDSNIVNPPTYEWKFLSGNTNAPPNAHSAKLRAILASKTTEIEALAYFDDLVFEKVDSPTSTPSPTPSSPAVNNYSNIYISEYMAYPESGDEWVELYNDNNFEVNLNGWYLDDIVDGGSSPKSISGIISAHNYKQFFLSGAFLNNDGDDVRLLNGSQDEKDNTSFELSTKGKSWSKDSSGDWCEVDPTAGSLNPDCPMQTLSVISSLTLIPTPTPSKPPSTPTPTRKPTPSTTPKASPTPTSETEFVLAAATTLSPTASPAVVPENKSSGNLFPVILIGAGMLFLTVSGVLLLKNKNGGYN